MCFCGSYIVTRQFTTRTLFVKEYHHLCTMIHNSSGSISHPVS